MWRSPRLFRSAVSGREARGAKPPPPLGPARGERFFDRMGGKTKNDKQLKKSEDTREVPCRLEGGGTGAGTRQVPEGARGMPWLPEAMKDVISCDNPGVGANDP